MSGQDQTARLALGYEQTAEALNENPLISGRLVRLQGVKNGLADSFASFETALTLIRTAEETQKYFKDKNAQAQDSGATDSARNGSTRKMFAAPVGKLVGLIDERFPGITPNHLTTAGEALVEASLIASVIKPRWGAAMSLGPYAVGSLIDGLDGNLARRKGQGGTLEGMLKDVRADKRQEIATAAANSLLAKKSGNTVAANQYAIAAMTATLPALMRATAESQGFLVNEDATGSRVTRGIEGGIGLGMSNSKKTAETLSALMVTGNLITAGQRAHVVVHGEESPYCAGNNFDPDFQQHGEARSEALFPIALAGVAIGSGLLINNNLR